MVGDRGSGRLYFSDSPTSPIQSPSMETLSLKQSKVTFTGKFASMTREEACQIVREAGGEPTPAVSRRTSFVVVGMEGWPLLPDGMISNKLKRAEAISLRGHCIHIISEAAFLE